MGFIVMPKERLGGRKLPVIVFNRGGNGMFGALTLADLLEHVFPLAEQGYVVMASQYRGVPGPADGERSPDQFGGDDVHDVTRLLDMVQQVPEADQGNVFMLGQSRGAIMTFRALLDSPVPVRAVAIQSGAYDMHDLLAFRPEFERVFQTLVPDFAKHREEALDHRSVTRWPERLPAETAVLIVHGDEDERTPLGSAKRFAEQLHALGRPHEIVVLEGESHSLSGAREDVRARTLAWFRRFEQTASPTASLGH
jgi:dipeptidyl aminopeptidase/acylaminoacyl peptidase